MKLCSRCGEAKQESEFHWKNRTKGIRQSWCVECKTAYDRSAYSTDTGQGVDRKARMAERRDAARLRNNEYIWEYLSCHPCVDCGIDDIVVLEFDHLSNKKYNVAGMKSHSLAALVEEIAKCEVVCRNCHMRRTAERGKWGILSFRDGQTGKVACL